MKKKTELYRIIFSIGIMDHNSGKKMGEIRCLSTVWGNDISLYEPGDCYVEAIKKTTNPNTVAGLFLYKGKFESDNNLHQLSRPMTLKKIMKFVYSNKHLLYTTTNRCFGIALIDEMVGEITDRKSKKVNFLRYFIRRDDNGGDGVAMVNVPSIHAMNK